MDVHIPQLRYVEIPTIGVISLTQQETLVDQIAIKQEWQEIEDCKPTKTHFLQLPQYGIGISGTVITEGQKYLLPFDSCQNSQTAGLAAQKGDTMVQVGVDP